ncbi:MAG: GntR family transcriptional regulator [Gammaproteobacteria bacterium]|nr:GntR family transcriptional regulator [Gammaproteobacteria bacterium]
MFSLNPSSGIPIYRQIVQQARFAIASGRVAPGDRLPSVRTIATQLGVNPMTVSKAYSTLEQAGLVVRHPGIGMVVSEAGGDPASAIDTDAQALVQTAKQLGLSRRELVERINKQWEEEWADQPIPLRRSR